MEKRLAYNTEGERLKSQVDLQASEEKSLVCKIQVRQILKGMEEEQRRRRKKPFLFKEKAVR